METKEPQSKILVAVICFFLGGLGIHRLMMGYEKWWHMLIVSILTCGFGGAIWAIIDLVRILTGSLKMANGQDLV